MADDKKKPVAGAGGSTLFHKDHHKEVLYLLAALILLGAVVNQISHYFQTVDGSGVVSFWDSLVIWFKYSFWPVWKVVALIIAASSLVWGIFSFLKLQEVETADEKIYGHAPEEAFLEVEKPAIEESKNWVRVVELSNSSNASDWRLAIIEADVMLEEMLREAGYHGEGVGEMLKAVDPTDMLTLQAAWGAHKVRNQIAHGDNFNLDERETRRVIALFESVFREFRVI